MHIILNSVIKHSAVVSISCNDEMEHSKGQSKSEFGQNYFTGMWPCQIKHHADIKQARLNIEQ